MHLLLPKLKKSAGRRMQRWSQVEKMSFCLFNLTVGLASWLCIKEWTLYWVEQGLTHRFPTGARRWRLRIKMALPKKEADARRLLELGGVI
jgi:hypothetical protein